MGAVMVPAGDILILHGGYRSNYQYESMWLFDTNLGTWREKMDFVHPLYHDNCTDDFGPQDQKLHGEPIQANSHVLLQEFHYFEQIDSFAKGPELPTRLQDHAHTKAYLISNDGYNNLQNLSSMSVEGTPTRNSVNDGRFGRNIDPIGIPQPRRRAPGWDGCRERLDGNLDDRGKIFIFLFIDHKKMGSCFGLL